MANDLEAEFFGAPTGAAPTAATAPVKAVPRRAPEDAPEPTLEEAPAIDPNGPTMGSTTGAIIDDVATGVTEFFPAITAGVRAGVNETTKMVVEGGNALNKATAAMGGFDEPADEVAPQIPELWGEPTSNTGHVIKGVSQFITGYVTGGRVLKLLKIGAVGGSVVQSAARSFLSGATAFDPYEGRLSDMLKDNPYVGQLVTDYVAADDMDGKALARFKSGFEMAALAIPVDAFAAGLRGMKAARAGNMVKAREEAQLADDLMKEFQSGEASGMTVGKEIPRDAQGRAQMAGAADELPGTIHITDKHVSPYDPETTITRPTGKVEAYEPKVFTPEELTDLRQTWNDATHNGENIETNAGSIVYKNMARIENTNDAKAFANVLGVTEVEAYEKSIGAAMTHEQAVQQGRRAASALADYTGTNVDELFNRMAGDLTNMKDVVKRISGYRAMAEVYSKRSSDLARMIVNGDATEFGGRMHMLYEEFARSTSTLASIDPLVEGIKSNLGRGLSILKAKVGPGDTGTQAAISTLTAADKTGIEQLAARMALVSDPKAAFKTASDSFGRKLIETHNEYWINALLSGPKTHAVNIMSSVIKSALVMPTEQVIAGMIGRDPAVMRMASDQYVGFYKGMGDSIKMANAALKANDAILDVSHMGMSEGGGAGKAAITGPAMGLANDTPIGALITGLGGMIRMSSRLLTTEDELLKQINYRARLYSMGMREARGQSIGKADVAEFVEQYVARGFDEDGKGINEAALAYARDATFTKDLAVPTWGGRKSIGEGVQSFAVEHPGFRAILPFTKVPTNLLRDAVDHTPGMNMLRKEWHAEIAAGGERADMAYAKLATGGALWAAAITLAMQGKITGSGPPGPVAAREKTEGGWQRNSIKFEGVDGKVEYVDFSRMEPYATALSLAATFAENMEHMDTWKSEEIAGSMTFALAKNIENKTYLQGLTEFLDMIHTKDVTQGSLALRKRFGSYVPSWQAAFNGRDYLADPHTFLQAAQARTFEQAKVDPKFNLLGDRVKAPIGWGGDLSPFALSPSDRQDDTLKELARLSAVHENGLAYPVKKLSGVDLTGLKVGDLSANARLQDLIGSTRVMGKTLRESMTELFASEKYKTGLHDGDPDHDSSRMLHVTALLQRYRSAAGAALQKESPLVREAIRAEEQKKATIMRFGTAGGPPQ